MKKQNFFPDLKDRKVVSGIIYMTSHRNIYKVVEIVSNYLKETNDEEIYNYFVQTVASYCKDVTFLFLASVFSVTNKQNRKFIQKVINEPIVVESIINSKNDHTTFDPDYITVIAKNHDIINKENALKILKSNTNKTIFAAFGYHPALAVDVDLQTQWIFTLIEEPKFVIKALPWYVTDQALEKAATESLYKTMRFIEIYLEGQYIGIGSRALFSTEAMRKVATLYAISHGSSYAQRILSLIKIYEEKLSVCHR